MRFAHLMTLAVVAAGPALALGQPSESLSPGQKVLLQSRDEQPPVDPESDMAPPPKLDLSSETGFLQRTETEDQHWQRVIPQNDIFRPRQWSISYLTGYIGVNLGPMRDIPFQMLPNLIRMNCMWNTPDADRFMRGAWEGIAEITCLPVVNGPATIVIGGSLMCRYNFVAWKNRSWNPYFQMGGGGSYTDEYLFGSPVLSSGFEFIIQNAIGVNVRLGERWSLNAEWAFYHLSNGGLIMPNVSVNQLGGLIGLTYYFKKKDRN